MADEEDLAFEDLEEPDDLADDDLDELEDDDVIEDEEEEEEETPDPEERVEGATRALTKRPGEFTCQSCFLVKHPSQLADPDRMLCRDCV